MFRKLFAVLLALSLALSCAVSLAEEAPAVNESTIQEKMLMNTKVSRVTEEPVTLTVWLDVTNQDALGKLIDKMEQMGVVGAPDGNKPRQVMMTRQEYMEMVLNNPDM